MPAHRVLADLERAGRTQGFEFRYGESLPDGAATGYPYGTLFLLRGAGGPFLYQNLGDEGAANFVPTLITDVLPARYRSDSILASDINQKLSGQDFVAVNQANVVFDAPIEMVSGRTLAVAPGTRFVFPENLAVRCLAIEDCDDWRVDFTGVRLRQDRWWDDEAVPPVTGSGTGCVRILNCTNGEFIGGTFSGGLNGMDMISCSNVLVRDTILRRSIGYGFLLAGCSDCELEGVETHRCVNDGIRLIAGNSNITIRGTKHYSCGMTAFPTSTNAHGGGIQLQGVDGCTCIDNEIIGATGIGFYIKSNIDPTTTYLPGILFGYPKNIKVNGLHVLNCGSDNIRIQWDDLSVGGPNPNNPYPENISIKFFVSERASWSGVGVKHVDGLTLRYGLVRDNGNIRPTSVVSGGIYVSAESVNTTWNPGLFTGVDTATIKSEFNNLTLPGVTDQIMLPSMWV